jgi:hypothetical protein
MLEMTVGVIVLSLVVWRERKIIRLGVSFDLPILRHDEKFWLDNRRVEVMPNGTN